MIRQTEEMDAQAHRDFLKSDRRLNRVYAEVARRVSSPVTRRKLVLSERAWLAYRDAKANYEARIFADGGLEYPLYFDNARTEMTDQRVKQLRRDVWAISY